MHPETLERFAARFAAYGLRPRGPVSRLRPGRVLRRPHRAPGVAGAADRPRQPARPAGGRARGGAGGGRRRGPAPRLLRAPPAGARDPRGRPVRGHASRSGGRGWWSSAVRPRRPGTTATPRPPGELIGADGWLATGRPRLSGRRRAVPHRPAQGPHHQGRAEPAPARGRRAGERRRGRARRVRGRLRRRRPRAGHRAVRRNCRDAADRRRGPCAARAGRRQPHRRRARRAARPRGDPLARRGAQDVERQDPPGGHARGVPRGAAAGQAAGRGRPVGARPGAFRTRHVPALVRDGPARRVHRVPSPRCCCRRRRSSGPCWPRARGAAGRRAWSDAGRG